MGYGSEERQTLHARWLPTRIEEKEGGEGGGEEEAGQNRGTNGQRKHPEERMDDGARGHGFDGKATH